MRPESRKSWTLSSGIWRSCSVRVARDFSTGTSAAARRKSSSRVRSAGETPEVALLFTAPMLRRTAPESEGRSERQAHRPREELHQRRRAAAGANEARRKVDSAGLRLGEADAGREAQALEVGDERVVGIEAARRAPQRVLVVRESDAARAPPFRWLRDDPRADGVEGVGAGMPHARPHEHLAGRQVQIVARRIRVLLRLEGEEESRVGLVRRLVAAEPRIPVDAQQRATRGVRVGDEMGADRPETGRDRRDEAEQWVAYLGEVTVLVRVEPLAVVVAPELSEEAKEVAADVRRRHRQTDRCRPPSTWMRSPVM